MQCDELETIFREEMVSTDLVLAKLGESVSRDAREWDRTVAGKWGLDFTRVGSQGTYHCRQQPWQGLQCIYHTVPQGFRKEMLQAFYSKKKKKEKKELNQASKENQQFCLFCLIWAKWFFFRKSEVSRNWSLASYLTLLLTSPSCSWGKANTDIFFFPKLVYF